MAALGNALAMNGVAGQIVAFDDQDPFEMVGKHARRAHPADPAADYDGVSCCHVLLPRF
jgi:hypothetical protein